MLIRAAEPDNAATRHRCSERNAPSWLFCLLLRSLTAQRHSGERTHAALRYCCCCYSLRVDVRSPADRLPLLKHKSLLTNGCRLPVTKWCVDEETEQEAGLALAACHQFNPERRAGLIISVRQIARRTRTPSMKNRMSYGDKRHGY
ncbi:hypothetical protein Baya_16685 [Bagarius yarrelli]|uniref:Uncharacterized protein n=1 Tax=Bagarius yarrelli TaxID=175774 RepID=A0A556VW75_BAGYA|nr:hypothetical protein Baya_16685 [Bagarius yarrelli]